MSKAFKSAVGGFFISVLLTLTAAALAALVWARHPDWTAQQVREALLSAARPPLLASWASDMGHRMITLP